MPTVRTTCELLDHSVNQLQLEKLREEASTVSCWNFKNALGETVLEKYHSFYTHLSEVTQVLVAKGSKGYFWISASPAICQFLEQAPDFHPCPEYLPMGLPGIQVTGILARRWRVYLDPDCDPSQILVGCGGAPEPRHCATIRLERFVI